jgi:hypothetical protein
MNDDAMDEIIPDLLRALHKGQDALQALMYDDHDLRFRFKAEWESMVGFLRDRADQLLRAAQDFDDAVVRYEAVVDA